MSYQNLYVGWILICLALAGSFFLRAGIFGEHRRNRFSVKSLKNKFFGNQFETKEQQLLQKYKLFRYIFFLFLFIVLLANGLERGDIANTSLLFLAIGYLLSSPKSSFLGITLPYQRLVNFFMTRQREAMNIEIVRAMSQLKNLAIMKKDDPPGVMFVLNQLQKSTRVLRPIFEKMVALYSQGRKNDACRYFEEAVGTLEARNFAAVLKKLDDLKPDDFVEQIVYFQESIRRERETKKMQINETRTNFIFTGVFTSALVVMTNFIVVVFYIETVESMKYLF